MDHTHGHHQGGHAHVIPRLRRRAEEQEQAGQVGIALPSREHERLVALTVGGVECSAALIHENTCSGRLALDRRQHERRQALLVARVDLCPGVQQQPH
eukprot:scaffold72055_cov60-Phaeocystis_antarctica.AAC.2